MNKDLLNTLTKVAKSKTLPILNNVKFETGKLTATDLDNIVIIEDKAVTQNGYVNGAKLKKSGLESVQKHWALVDETDFQAEDFPNIKLNELTHEVNQATISAIIEALTTVSKDDARPLLTSIEVANGTVTATDSYRLLTRGAGHKFTFNLSSATAELIKATKLVNNNWRIGYDTEQITLKNGNITIVGRLIQGTYPDWRKIVPTVAAHQVTLKTADLYEALGLIENGNIRVNFDKTTEVLVSGSETKRTTIPAVSADENVTLNINHMHVVMPLKDSHGGVTLQEAYVRDAIGKATHVRISYNGVLEPTVVEGLNL